MNKPIISCTGNTYALVSSTGMLYRYRCVTCGQEFTQSNHATTAFPTPHPVIATVSQLFSPFSTDRQVPA